ncbi:hypothetical protein BTO04_00345 [Polaribacter sp. SA4-10]|uniref:hypothetical protein n=1 Tax=Polaribacter sp. SA4-10 TaxID=754397 RepID=UPI000B3CB1CC|nr:hypothetical protein [Polaribacter sp. SA4-10]ARV05234.1 hypothetical protein BTO04_00345 [Polaribacter sp. SA4-10]
MKIKKTLQLLIGLLFITIHFSTFSQKEQNVTDLIETKELPNDLRQLEKERLHLIAEMYGMMYEISSLFTELERSTSLEQFLVETADYANNAKHSDSLSIKRTQSIKRLSEIKSQIIFPELKTISGKSFDIMQSMSATEGFRRIIEIKVQEILKKTDKLSGIGAKVTELNNTSYVSQNFKKQISWSFAFLVGLVIIGFFIIAAKDDKIRESIFSGDKGLQFITIFSIIIAIILFGITGVLGGKEISALIGGISGYILGRSSNAKSTN